MYVNIARTLTDFRYHGFNKYYFSINSANFTIIKKTHNRNDSKEKYLLQKSEHVYRKYGKV